MALVVYVLTMQSVQHFYDTKAQEESLKEQEKLFDKILIEVKLWEVFVFGCFRFRDVPGLDTVVPLETTAAYDIKDVILGVSLVQL